MDKGTLTPRFTTSDTLYPTSSPGQANDHTQLDLNHKSQDLFGNHYGSSKPTAKHPGNKEHLYQETDFLNERPGQNGTNGTVNYEKGNTFLGVGKERNSRTKHNGIRIGAGGDDGSGNDEDSTESSEDSFYHSEVEGQPLLRKDPPTKLGATNFLIYCSHFLSAWGDRMWTFAVGLFLVNITPDSLQLTAIYGLTMGSSVLLFGPIIGDWVDNTARLKAARISLVLQNMLVVLCAAVIYSFLAFKEELLDIGEWTRYVTYALIIVFASAANLATIANTIAVERDWIVEICASDEEKLATMTATMRAIDLTTQILAPIATGQVMTYADVENGAIFIGCWNFVSVIAEYYLIWKVYNTIPALQKRKDFKKGNENEDLLIERKAMLVESVGGTHSAIAFSGSHKVSQDLEKNVKDVTQNVHLGDKAKEKTCSERFRIFSGITIIIEGWKTFARYEVMLSGISLSLLYMTVLGFDNVTVGYAKIQGLSESVVGIMMGGGGLFGIFGTFMYPVIRRRTGLPMTGLVSLTLQSACLTSCIVSVWLPGSPFDLENPDPFEPVNCTNLTVVIPIKNSSSDFPLVTVVPDTFFNVTCPEEEDKSLVSVGVLMGGIIAARFGLWMADLSITQMFMETVVEQERGIVNGVQNSLNQLMDMIKFGLVVGLPLAPQFGLLVIISFAFVFGGWILYCVFLCKTPKDLFSHGSTQGYQSFS